MAPAPATAAEGNFIHSEFRKLVQPKVLFFAIVFCIGQLAQELIAEAIFTRYEFPRPSFEVAMVYSLFQQMGTVVIALLTMSRLSSNSPFHATPIAAVPPINNKDHSSFDSALSSTKTWMAEGLLTCLIFASSVFPNLALNYVHFPAKIVAKSTKLVPTMMLSVFMGNSRKFSFVDYISALLLCSGAVLFAFNSRREDGDGGADQSDVTSQVSYGIFLLALACFADALVPNIQQFLMRTGSVSSAEQLAFRVNAIGSTVILVYIVILARAWLDWVEIFEFEPLALVLLSGTALASGVFVVAYTMLIQEAGSVVAMAVATARKVLTLTLSYVVFPGRGKVFGWMQFLSALTVGLGMALGPLYERYLVQQQQQQQQHGKYQAVPV